MSRLGPFFNNDKYKYNIVREFRPCVVVFKASWVRPTQSGVEDMQVETTNLLKTSFAVGPDELNSSIAKLSMEAIADPLTSIINSSFSTGQIPSDLKIAKITPIY